MVVDDEIDDEEGAHDNIEDMVKKRPTQVPEIQFIKLIYYWSHSIIQVKLYYSVHCNFGFCNSGSWFTSLLVAIILFSVIPFTAILVLYNSGFCISGFEHFCLMYLCFLQFWFLVYGSNSILSNSVYCNSGIVHFCLIYLCFLQFWILVYGTSSCCNSILSTSVSLL
ncbi:uncharacterized protein DS421_15g500770 [Arachis hypogaea]|nr:uncharacterized protein DS421_15g500770 [Arachis hypogaea]